MRRPRRCWIVGREERFRGTRAGHGPASLFIAQGRHRIDRGRPVRGQHAGGGGGPHQESDHRQHDGGIHGAAFRPARQHALERQAQDNAGGQAAPDAERGGREHQPQRRAVTGSIEDARYAGSTQAAVAAPIKRATTASTMAGSMELPSAQRASMPLSARLRTTPAARPPPTLSAVNANTSRSTWVLPAPNAIRMPNSLVRWATI